MQPLKIFVRRLLTAAGLRLIRANHPAARFVDHLPSAPLDFLILWLFPDARGIRFLQIGAHDGRRNDPLFRWITACEWRGCFVEPMPDYARRLRELHANRPDLEILECAIATTSGPASLYRINPALKGLPDWAEGIATLDRIRAEEATHALGLTKEHLVTESVSTITMGELLQRCPVPGPSVVAIDTEGFDVTLVHALLDADARPALLHFEHACAPPEDWWKLLRRLHELGYETATHGPDTTAFRRK